MTVGPVAHGGHCVARHEGRVVFVPEYVVGRWWENLLHNQSALRIKGRLLFEPGVMVTSVPWQLRSGRDAAAVEAGVGRR